VTTVKRPARLFSFSDWTKAHPKDQPPGDRLDAQFIELIEAIRTTQAALAQIRRDDGLLKNNTVTKDHLVPGFLDKIVDDIHAKIAPVALTVTGTAAAAREAERNASLYAKDAEAAVQVAKQLASGMSAIRGFAEYAADVASRAASSVDMDATDAENWGNYAKAQADNAEADKNEALAWAEFLAGPVVDAAAAPAYIADSPFPHGLYYQPVEGGVAGMWSSKWWALRAQQLVGTVGLYYLGAWDHPPLAGESNPNTGQTVPSPLLPGSIYFDSTTGQLYVWDGLVWKKSVSLTATFQASYVYTATTNQQDFSGADVNGATPVVGVSPSDVHVNGVRLVPTLDYTVDNVGNILHINSKLTANSTVQWDMLVPPGQVAAGSVHAWKIKALTPDGTVQDFHLQYLDSGGVTTDANVGDGAQLMVSLDGAMQEPGIDYTASGNTLHMAQPPSSTSHLWAVWYQPGAAS
jgi:hypothetical protein